MAYVLIGEIKITVKNRHRIYISCNKNHTHKEKKEKVTPVGSSFSFFLSEIFC